MEYLGDNSAVIEKWQADGANGGVNMTLELSREMAELIDDFSYIPTDDIIPGQERFTYDPEKALAHFLQKLEGVQKNGYLTTTEMERGREIVGTMNQPLPNLVFNNGDFYPRNLIPKNGVE